MSTSIPQYAQSHFSSTCNYCCCAFFFPLSFCVEKHGIIYVPKSEQSLPKVKQLYACIPFTLGKTPLQLFKGGKKNEDTTSIFCSFFSFFFFLFCMLYGIMLNSNFLFPQVQVQWIECHYNYAQMKNVNLGRPSVYLFFSIKKYITIV